MSETTSGTINSIDLCELEETTRLRWAIKNHAVVAIWREKPEVSCSNLRYLGNRTPHNQEDTNFRIWIGENAKNRQLLVVLDIQIRLRASRKAHPRRMFLVVPSESLRIETAVLTYGELQKNDVPQSILETPGDLRSAESTRVLCISFVLGHDESCKVVMPKAQCSRATKGQPLDLLLSLRSLSRAQKFDVYLNYNTYAQQDLGELRNTLNKSNLFTPSIDLTSMYAGRGGKINDWPAQGLFEDNRTTSESKRRKTARDDDAGTGVVEQCPPPYSTSSGQVLVPRSCTPEPFILVDIPSSCVPETPSIPWSQFEGPKRRSSTALISRPNLIDTSHQPAPTRGLESPSPTNAPSLARAQTSADAPCLMEDSRFKAATAPLFPPPHNASALGGPSYDRSPLSSRIYIDMCLWLTKAWVTCPDAHFIFSAPLLGMGAAAHDKDEVSYARKRAESTTDLLYYQAQNKMQVCTQTGMSFLRKQGREVVTALREKALKQETTRMVSWMNLIRPHADLPLMDECLARWVEKGIQLIQFDEDGIGDSDVYSALLDDFGRSKAFCVAETCLSFGKGSLAHLDDIVARLHREAQH